ncbi:MAG: hypothetical protein GF383_02635 [Candidatus Lokiarchaeota archaeon]|nr:hypothetical protein [Candidatus Lokiarchaeota archaeon]
MNLTKKDKELLKLSKLCQHWAEHNESHKESFIKWLNIAKDRGLSDVVEDLSSAVKTMDECNKFLLSAKDRLDNTF